MKKNITKIWTKALKSKKYKQGTGCLCKIKEDGQTEFCCLGVLTDLYQQHQKKNKKKMLRVSIKNSYVYVQECKIVQFANSSGLLPKAVQEWAGIKYSNGSHLEKNTNDNYDLAEMNDNGWSFKDIADYIETNSDQL
jgi:hypothetical protein